MVAVPARVGSDTPDRTPDSTGGVEPTGSAGAGGATRPLVRLAVWIGVGLAVCAGLLLRRPTGAPLWLDEALSVGIAARPVPDLLAALRSDGSPPLYYLLLHGWTAAFGTEPGAVRLLSALFSLAALPVGYAVAARVGGRPAGVAALLLLTANPFLIRYATETRMYSLVVLLSLLAVAAGLRAWERPTTGRLVAVAAVTGALLLTHYWTVFALAAAAGAVLVVGLRHPRGRNPALRLLAAGAAGGLLFAPWAPTFWFQIRHTGTPWAQAADLRALPDTVRAWAGGNGGWATVLALSVMAAVLVAVGPRRTDIRSATAGVAAPTIARVLAGVAAGGLLLAVLASRVAAAGFAARYTSAFIAPALLAAALGMAALRPRLRVAVVAAVTVLGLLVAGLAPPADERTQAGRTAAVLTAAARPGDLVLYCPDQLGPAVSRLLPDTVDQLVYPTLTAPDLVDWVDYGPRNAAADPVAIAARLDAVHPGRMWVVTASGYRTFADQCEQLVAALADRRGGAVVAQVRDFRYAESQAVRLVPADPDRG